MANFAKLTIQFTGLSSEGAELRIRWNNGVSNFDYDWTCVLLRSNPYDYTKSTTTAIDQTTKCFNAVKADVANDSLINPYCTVTQTATDTFVIEAIEYGWSITDNTTTNDVQATLTATAEVLPTKNFQLTGYTLSQASNACADVKITLTENGDGVSPYTWISPSNSSNSLIADLTRTGSTISITIEDNDGDQATLNNVLLPGSFNATFITNISVVANAGGLDSTVTVFMSNPLNLNNYTYSIDGTNFFTSNIFSGVLDGNYTLYVNDGFGCIATQNFTVQASANVPRLNPIGYVPNDNTLRHVQSILNQYQTLENTLYRDEYYLGENKPFFAQPFQTNDGVIVTQFRTNYDIISCRLIDFCDQTIETTLTPVQKSDNIGLVDKRDCIIYNYGDGQTGIYFTSGNNYDPITDDIIGTYVLNGTLPDFGVAGNTITLDGIGNFLIKQTKYDSTVQANVLIIDYIWTSGNQSEAGIITCTYNSLAYEVYEFDIDLSTVTAGYYFTQIILEDSEGDYDTLVFNSELIEIATSFDHTNFIEYYDSDETGIDYSTGYKTYLRIESTDPYQNLTPGGTETKYNNAGNSQILKNTSEMIGTMFFQNCPRYMIEKLNILFGHKTVLINGLEWVREDNLDTNNFDKAALKTASINLKRRNYNVNRNDNILIDGPNGRIIQETGAILY